LNLFFFYKCTIFFKKSNWNFTFFSRHLVRIINSVWFKDKNLEDISTINKQKMQVSTLKNKFYEYYIISLIDMTIGG